MATNFQESGLNVYRTTHVPARTASPTAILTHIARSALGEMFGSAKKPSRRRRRTLGNEDAPEGSTIGDEEPSEGTSSAVSGSGAITASVSNVIGASASRDIGLDALPGGAPLPL